MEKDKSLGLDYHATDILPLIPQESLTSYNLRRLQELLTVTSKCPERFRAADGRLNLPYEGATFDLVMSTYALPHYASTFPGVIGSLFEMIRVSRKLVAFNAYSSFRLHPTLDAVCKFGGDGSFGPLISVVLGRIVRDLQDELDVQPMVPLPYLCSEGYLHLDVSRARRDRFSDVKAQFLEHPDTYIYSG